MTKSELIERLSLEQPHLPPRDVEFSVNAVLDYMRRALVAGDRIEIRGFGSIGLRYRMPRTGRNPKTGDSVSVPGKYVPHFKPGRLLRERVNQESVSQILGDEASSGTE
ncbi:MAG: integration host factor subunit beta [Proteobacteria bacterium]|nr:integration host factor subunit beta [Pseudomonadota bacterium]MBT5227974.1 integration host factor subunit beta [Pseudomonadota bacterium]MBT5818389.1 integration host factor subunit beta [Pseudomonadota bacterium]